VLSVKLTIARVALTMALVSYSDSEASDSEPKPTTQSTSKPSTNNSAKPNFKKVVDRSNPHKIRVNLPEPSNRAAGEDEEEQGPPTKKAKIGLGPSSGFNSFLPAPKRDAATNGRPAGGLGRGFSLKTGAAPGFSREPLPTLDTSQDEEVRGSEILHENVKDDDDTRPTLLQGHASEDGVTEGHASKKANIAMFKPLSVARKPKKKRIIAVDGFTAKDATATTPSRTVEPAKRDSLFSTGDGDHLLVGSSSKHGEYRPMLYKSASAKTLGDWTSQSASNPYASYTNEGEAQATLIGNETQTPDSGPEMSQSLDNIAADLNLSASAKRQLLGRSKANQSSINIVNFDTDREYAANEMLRQAGEQAQHNPVRAIAPGKHSLKQLVNAASIQKDALEEHFASGRRNKKEAGSKYGW